MRIVLDTNVWVSALISPAGTPAALMRKLEDHVLITSEDMLEKVQRILRYKRIADRYNVTPGMAKEYVENIRASAVLVAANLPDTPIVEADPSDDMFLVCAAKGRADCIVSGDRHLLRLAVYQGIPIVSSATLLAFFNSDSPEKNESPKGTETFPFA